MVHMLLMLQMLHMLLLRCISEVLRTIGKPTHLLVCEQQLCASSGFSLPA
jgi:hypothetical protein